MKIEKLNKRQIRCILTHDDLASRQMLFSQLVYDNPRARILFHEILLWASFKFGFDGMETPLMIEAVPLTQDRAAVIFTRIEGLSLSEADELGISDVYSVHAGPDNQSWPGQPADLRTASSEQSLSGAGNENDAALRNGSSVPDSSVIRQRLFVFQSLDALLCLSHILAGTLICPNTLFLNPADDTWYLSIRQSSFPDEAFLHLCAVIGEYGRQAPCTPYEGTYLSESLSVIIREDALQKLSEL